MKESHIGRKFVMNNWYELPAMIPIVIFASAQSIDTYDGIITLLAIFRLLVIIYVIRMSRSLEDKSRILGGHTTSQIFVVFFLTLNILAFLFYTAERPVANSQITTMADALWWTIQTASTATFGPDPDTAAGRIVGSIIMFVGIGITGIFISTLAAGLVRSRAERNRNQLGYDMKQMIKGRIDGLENLSTEDMELLLSLIRTYHESPIKSKTGP
jgi:voltage-gated potassium channel